MTADNVLFEIKGLKKNFGDLEVLKGIHTTIRKGEVVVVIGPSGSGKSFFMNHLVRQYWEQNTHIILIDIGNSYKGLCDLIHQRTNGEDGIYYTYSEKHPIAFNPFFTEGAPIMEA